MSLNLIIVIFIGTVSPKVYWWYFRAMNIPLCILFLVFFVAFNALQIFSNIWLSTMNDDEGLKNDMIFMYTDKAIISKLQPLADAGQLSEPYQSMYNWANQNLSEVNEDLYNRRDKYLWWYLGYGGFQAIVVAVFSITFSFMVASASRYIHASMLGTTFQLCSIISRSHIQYLALMVEKSSRIELNALLVVHCSCTT